jgi:hypothetical protein
MNTAKFLKKVEGLATLERPRYSPGLLLEDEDLTAGVDYTREITRLLFRSLFGCGVICGLDVKATLKCKRTELHVEVGPGVGLDGSGNPLHVPKTQQLAYDPDCEPMPERVWVVLCYKDKDCRPKDVSCSGDDDNRSEHTRSRDGFVIKLYDGLPDCACACAKPEPGKPARRLGRCCHDEEEEEYAAAQRRADAIREAGLRAMLERETLLRERERALFERERLISGAAATGGPLHEYAPTMTMETMPPVAAPAEPRPKLPEICACYEDHNAGKCVPDCGCSCVVLARIDTKAPDDKKDDDVEVPVDERVRRRIRPVLTGYLECLEPVKPPKTEPETPKLTVECHLDPATIESMGTTTATAKVSGAAGGTLTYTWTSTPEGTIVGAGDRATFTAKRIPSANLPTTATITVAVSDGSHQAKSSCTVTITNRP